ncbi:alanine racemase [Kaarinaea lacus]
MTRAEHLTKAYIHLDHLTHNIRLLQELVGKRPMWPAIKANAYGHDLEIVGRHLVEMGYSTLCVAHVTEAIALKEAGIEANLILLSATLPEHSEAIVAYDCEPAVCTMETVEALALAANKADKPVFLHLMVDTGMGRIGIHPDEVELFLKRCLAFPGLRVRGLMSHFPRADEKDKTVSNEQIKDFLHLSEITKNYDIEYRHMANSAAVFDLPAAYFDAVRPGIAIYGLRPSWQINNSRVEELKPVLEWKSHITFLKEVPAGTGLSYGHAYYTKQPSLIATVPVGYGDGLNRNLSNNMDMIVQGVRCPQVGRITMDQSLVDVTSLRGRIRLGDEVVMIGRQGNEKITADEIAKKLNTINYEVVTAISQRVQRVVVREN